MSVAGATAGSVPDLLGALLPLAADAGIAARVAGAVRRPRAGGGGGGAARRPPGRRDRDRPTLPGEAYLEACAAAAAQLERGLRRSWCCTTPRRSGWPRRWRGGGRVALPPRRVARRTAPAWERARAAAPSGATAVRARRDSFAPPALRVASRDPRRASTRSSPRNLELRAAARGPRAAPRSGSTSTGRSVLPADAPRPLEGPAHGARGVRARREELPQLQLVLAGALDEVAATAGPR